MDRILGSKDEARASALTSSAHWRLAFGKVSYGILGILLAVTGNLGNALVSANLPSIEGDLSLTPVEGAWLSASYVMVYVSANLLLIKFRKQFGVETFALLAGLGYAVVTALHLIISTFPVALMMRAASGFVSAPMNTLAVLYLAAALPKAQMGRAIIIALGSTQLAVPLAWIMSPALLDAGEWHTLYRFDAGLAFCSLAAILILKLPPAERTKEFEPLDFVSFALLAPALALVVAVLAEGPVQWWTSAPWMAYALIVSLVLFTLAAVLESTRSKPLIDLRWLGGLGALRLLMSIVGFRFLLAEQSYAVLNLERMLGMGPDQLRSLYLVIFFGVLCGIVFGALTFSKRALLGQLLFSVALLAVGISLDRGATNLVRPQEFFLSQSLIAIANGMFLGPLLLFGVSRAIAQGSHNLVSFVIFFTVSQNIGSLGATATLSSFEYVRSNDYVSLLSDQLNPASPIVASRLTRQALASASRSSDVSLGQASSVASLAASTRREAGVRSFNDIFVFTSFIGIAFLLWGVVHGLLLHFSSSSNRQAIRGDVAL